MNTKAKKILYVAPTFFPDPSQAHTLSTLKMAKAMQSHGFQVKFIGMKTSKFESVEHVLETYGIESNFDLDFMEGKLSRIENLFTKIKRRILRFKFGSFVKRKVTDFKPDIIYVRVVAHPYFTFRKLSPKSNVPIVCEMHGIRSLGGDFINKSLFERFLKKNNVIRITTNNTRSSRKLAKCLEDLNIDITCGFLSSDDPDKIMNRTKDSSITLRGKYPFNVGYTGNIDISGLRGTYILLKLAENFSNIGFHIVGGKNSAINYWKNEVQTENIFFYGHCPTKKVPEFLNKFDVFINPLQYKIKPNGSIRGSFPLKIPEYLSHGKPIIISDVPGHKDLLNHESNCLKCDFEDINAWEQNLKRLIESPELRDRLGREARKTYEKHLTHKKRIEKAFAGLL